MARTVDEARHEQRKAAIAQAVWALAARSGLEAVSLREVAAEAGVSMGRVQHYFRTKDDMLMYGLKLAQDRMTERIQRRDPDTPEGLLRATIDELLGDDPDTRQAAKVWVAFLGRALDDPKFAEVLFADDVELRAFTAQTIGGEFAEVEAHLIWSLANGLTAEVACGTTSVQRARAVMSHHLERVLSSCRTP